MKKEYPSFKAMRVDDIKIKPKDQKILDKFIIDVGGSAGEKRTRNIKSILIKIYYSSEVGLDKWDYYVLSQFLQILNNSDKQESSKNDIKKTLKRFLLFQYDDWTKRFKNFKTPAMKQKKEVNQDKRGKDKLLSCEDVEKLIAGSDKLLFKGLFSLAEQSAGRPTELLSLKIKDLDFNNNKVKLTRFKTGNISNLLLKDMTHLENHINLYPYPNPQPNDFLFPSPLSREKHIAIQTVTSHLNTIGKRVLGRSDLYMYLFRHGTLNLYRSILSPDQYVRFADHSLEVGMKMYGHNNEEDLDREMKERVYGKKLLTKEEKETIKELKKQLGEQDKRLKEFEAGMPEKIQQQLNLFMEKKAEGWQDGYNKYNKKFDEEAKKKWKKN